MKVFVNLKIKNSYDFTIEQFVSGKGIEKIFDNDRLDIEFCIKNKKIYIFHFDNF